ncbi:Replication factor C (RF-C) subunit [Binucleata daphniae]
MVCEEIDAIMEALKSRCICVRVRGFTNNEINNIVSSYIENNTCGDLPEIVKRAKGNLRKALCLTEMKTTKSKTLDLEYEIVLNDIVNQVVHKQDGNTILSIRKELYNMLNSCIPARVIIKELSRRFKTKTNDLLMVCESALKYEERVLQGNKDILHLEGFIVEMMCIFYNK